MCLYIVRNTWYSYVSIETFVPNNLLYYSLFSLQLLSGWTTIDNQSSDLFLTLWPSLPVLWSTLVIATISATRSASCFSSLQVAAIATRHRDWSIPCVLLCRSTSRSARCYTFVCRHLASREKEDDKLRRNYIVKTLMNTQFHQFHVIPFCNAALLCRSGWFHEAPG